MPATSRSEPAMAPAPQERFEPLAGVRVLDLTRVLAGPYATMLLAELGADVIKVELPGGGDETRAWGPPFIDESSAYFHAVNRGKRSIALDLREEGDRELGDRLIGSADVLIENFRPGVTERLGIDPERAMALNPRLVYVSITGFGTSGPMASLAGTEVIVEAESGLMSITGDRDGEPVRFGVAMVDIATGLSAINALLAALLERERTGRGRRLELSLFATALSALCTVIAAESAGGPDDEPLPWGSAHPSIVPYRAFAAADGRHLVLGATNDPMWLRLCEALEPAGGAIPESWATNAGRVEDRDAVEGAIAAAVGALPAAAVIGRLQRHRVLVAPVAAVGAAARGEQARALGQVLEEGGVLFARSPLAGAGTRTLGRAPGLGEHGAEIAAEVDHRRRRSTDAA